MKLANAIFFRGGWGYLKLILIPFNTDSKKKALLLYHRIHYFVDVDAREKKSISLYFLKMFKEFP